MLLEKSQIPAGHNVVNMFVLIKQTARIWNVQTGEEARRVTTPMPEVRDASFSPDGKFILTAGGDSIARLWHADYHDTIRYLCGLLSRDLTPEERMHYGITDDGPTCRSQ